MTASVPDSPTPRPWARGLDLAALAALGVEGTTPAVAPEVPGYRVETLLGAGGLGHVWKATRLADGALVALKIPHLTDPAFVERLRGEAESLRTLAHPHVLRCLSHGELPNGHPWLALEYVDGAPLSMLIPQHGFAWSEALSHFRRIAAAVIHAHEKGVLHRDLKPGNVLIGHDGSLKVADFGLARPVQDRVVTFSLTLSGQVAGTAEYLAPECYARDGRPTAAADIYALGVILHELLAGHPPRGAWTPVSQQKQVDIRVDDVIRRALEPDPARRFASAQAMLDELERIARTPPRYAGTPRLTGAVRFLDFLWSVAGLFLLFGSFGLVARIEKYGIGLPVDLIGTETIRIGAFQGIFLLLVVAAPCCLWQLFRLWRFRRVPLRESLPSPFGLTLGTTRIAALSVFLAQTLFLAAPAWFGVVAWRDACSTWLREGDVPWTQGLVVTAGYRGRVAHDPWAWPEAGKRYSLREHSGWITDPLGRQIDHTAFIPGLVPRIMAGLASIHALTIALTVLSAFTKWWRFRKWGQAVSLVALLGLSARLVHAENRAHQDALSRQPASWSLDAVNYEYHARQVIGVRGWLFNHEAPPSWVQPPPEVLACYASSVTFDEGPPCTGPALAARLAGHAAEARAANRRSFDLMTTARADGPLTDHRFVAFSNYDDFTDPADGPATGGLAVLVLRGNILPKVGAEITGQSIRRQAFWSVDPRALPADEAHAWAQSFVTALATPPSPGEPDPLHALFLPHLLGFRQFGLEITPITRESVLDPMRDACLRGTRPRLARPPAPALDLPGARRRIVLEIEDRGQRSAWTVDLIPSDGRWLGVRLEF
jgi:hypothetical protein